MKKILSSLLLVSATALALLPFSRLWADESSQSADAEVEIVWEKDYDTAIAKAKAEGKRILVDFSGSDWCHWCKVMDKEVLSKQAFKDYADEHLVLLFIDTPRKPQPEKLARQSQILKNKYYIDGFPTFVVLNSEGAELDRRSGYVRGGPSNFINFLKVTEYAAAASSNDDAAKIAQ
ncbi:MAG: thioredoxin family protein [Opitutales bacterium]|nr:thioredoxin family protein [Opitutales bacterium]